MCRNDVYAQKKSVQWQYDKEMEYKQKVSMFLGCLPISLIFYFILQARVSVKSQSKLDLLK